MLRKGLPCRVLKNALASASLAATIAMAPVSASAQGAPPTYAQLVEQGRELAGKLCISCHVVGDRPEAPATVGIPTLRGIANRKDQTAGHIRNILINPHPPMPDVRLSYPEIDRLIAYIDSLRSEQSGPPLTPRGSKSTKPVYPDPT